MENNSSISKKKVIVILAYFNGSRFFKEQIDSIINQTHDNLEVLIIDDCSSDSLCIDKKLIKDKRIRVYRNDENLGFVKTFEKGLQIAKNIPSDFIALSDQDDIWNKNKLELLIENIGANDLIYSDAQLIDENGFPKKGNLKFYARGMGEVSELNLIIGNKNIPGCSIIFRSSLLRQVLPFPKGTKYHDNWICLTAINSSGLCFYDQSLFMYRIHDKNTVGLKLKAKSKSNKQATIADLERCLGLQAVASKIDLSKKGQRLLFRLIKFHEGKLTKFINLNIIGLIPYFSYLFPNTNTISKFVIAFKGIFGLKLSALWIKK